MRLPLVVLLSLASLACSLPAQTAGEIAGLLQREKNLEAAAQGLAACFPYEVSPHGEDILAAIAGLPSTAARRLPLAAFVLAAPDSKRLHAFLLERIGGKDSDERALAIGLAGFLPRPSADLRAAVVKALMSVDPASRFEAAIALGRPAFRDRLHSEVGASAEVMDALEETFADRSESVALAAARSWALGLPDQKRLEARRKVVESGRGSRLVGAVLTVAFTVDEATTASVAALMDNRRAGTAALWAFAHAARSQGFDAGEIRRFLGDPAQQKAEDRAELVLDLAALGLDCGEKIDFGKLDWDERTLEAFIRRGGAGTKIGKVAPGLAELEFTARILNAEVSPQLLNDKIVARPPFKEIWRAFTEAKRRGGFDLEALLPADPLLARLLRAGFLTIDDAELEIGDLKLAGRFDPAREIWGLAVPMLAGRSGFAPGAKFAALAEKLPARDRLLLAAAVSFGTEGEPSIVATRQAALIVMDDLLSRGDPAVLERKLPRDRGLHFRELADRVFLGLDAAPRRLAVTAALVRRPQVAPGVMPILADWADFGGDPELSRRVSAAGERDFWPPPTTKLHAEFDVAPGGAELLDRLEEVAGDPDGYLDPAMLHVDAPQQIRSGYPGSKTAPTIARRVRSLPKGVNSDYLDFIRLWAFPEGAEGGEEAAELRRRLLDEGGGGTEATALAAYQIAEAGSESEVERVEAALASEFRDVPIASLLGLLSAGSVPASLRDSLLVAAMDASPLLSVLAMDCLARLGGEVPDGLLEVVIANLGAKEPARKIAASRLLEQLKALSVAEVHSLGDHLDQEDIGAARLALAIGRLGRPDPRLRRRLELATCSNCVEKRVAARLALEMLWSEDSAPIETLLEWHRPGPVSGLWSELAQTVPNPPGPSQIEIIACEQMPSDSRWTSARLEIVAATMRRLVARQEFSRELVAPAADDPLRVDIGILGDRVAEELKAKASEEK